MTDAKKVETYTHALSKALRGLSNDELSDIVAEIRSHLEHRAAEGQLDAAIKGLGTPAICARAFRDELTLQDAFNAGSPGRTFSALITLATRRFIAAMGLFFASLFLMTSIGLAFSAVAKIFAPNAVGFWVDKGTKDFMFGVLPTAPKAGYAEVLGLWYVPMAGIVAIGLFLFGHQIGQLFLKLMMSRHRPLG
ncbi:MAG: hypothetical protein ABJ275_06795 [Maricaulaceae bacterium]